jgi:hypothetical protein
MQDMKTDLLLEAFDSFLSDINTALASKSFIEEENRALKAETEHLSIDAKRRDEMIASKNDEIARLLEKSSVVARALNLKAFDVKSEIRATAELVEMKYEVSYASIWMMYWSCPRTHFPGNCYVRRWRFCSRISVLTTENLLLR